MCKIVFNFDIIGLLSNQICLDVCGPHLCY